VTRPTLTPVLLVLLALLSAFTPLSIDMYLPALPVIAVDLNGTVGDIQLTLSAFMIAFGAGQIFYGPAGDRFGRRPVILVGLVTYVLASAGCAFAVKQATSCCCASCRGWPPAAAWCWRAPWCRTSPSATRRRAPCR
jgi:MFS family permease